MRNRLQWAVTAVLLAAQATTSFPGMVAASATSPVTSDSSQLEVSMNTKNANPIVIKTPAKPDFDTEVVTPLRATQAAEAKAAAEAAAAAAAKAKADADAAAAAAARTKAAASRVTTTAAVSLPAGSHTDWMAAAGIAPGDYGYVDYIVSNESGWGTTKWNRGGSGAYGLGQALPASKMAAFGSDYMTNPITQLRWANSYAVGRYGSWANAYYHWTSHHSW